jgi:hypothetical protein
MATQQPTQLESESHHPQKRPRWLNIIIIIACILTLLSFIGATIIWVGLVHDKLSDTLGAIFTALGTIFGFIALIFAIPPFIQYLQERRAGLSPISPLADSNNTNDQFPLSSQQSAAHARSIDSSKAQAHSATIADLGINKQQPSLPNQPSQVMGRTTIDNVNTLLQWRALTPKEKELLVDKLLAVRTMKNRNSRNQVVQDLNFANSIERDSNTSNKDDVMNIVNRCLDFSDGLQQLIERIDYREEENSIPMQQLKAFVNSLS